MVLSDSRKGSNNKMTTTRSTPIQFNACEKTEQFVNFMVNLKKRHIFFKGIDWNALFRKDVKPPFIPMLSGGKTDETDTHWFDNEFTRRTPRDSPAVPASAGANRLFRGFRKICQIISKKLNVECDKIA